MRIAVMQPYFLPYAGYFRLFAAADLFVVYDCVQFPRRGWVHRNVLQTATGEARWLTLPLVKAPREASITDLRYPEDAAALLADRGRSFPALSCPAADAATLADLARSPVGRPVDHIEALLAETTRVLDLERPMIRSSSLKLSPDVRGQDRILAIAGHLGATEYVNAPGGRDLYDAGAFAAAGITLRFLAPYAGSMASILDRLNTDGAAQVRAEVIAQALANEISDEELFS